MIQALNASVSEVFASYPREFRQPLLTLRSLIFDVAAANPAVGPLVETLRWGQPSYITEQTRSGTTVRIDRHEEYLIALYVPCQTTLIADFRGSFPQLSYSKNRAIVLDPRDDLPAPELAPCIEMALTYRMRRAARVQKPDSLENALARKDVLARKE